VDLGQKLGAAFFWFALRRLVFRLDGMAADGNRECLVFWTFGRLLPFVVWPRPQNLGARAQQGIFLLLLAAWLALFQFLGNSTFGYVDTRQFSAGCASPTTAPAPRPTTAHGNLIPFVVLGLFWWKRKELAGAAGPKCGGRVCCCWCSRWECTCLATSSSNPHQHPRVVHRHLWFDGAGVGTALAAREFLSVFSFPLRGAGPAR